MALSVGVYDLKVAQLNEEQITSFKNHKHESVKIHPRNEKNQYNPGDVITFDLKGQGVDYINMNNSSLFFKIYEPPTKELWLLYGSCGTISRFQITNGSIDLMDVNGDYGKYVYLEILGGAHDEDYKSYNVGIDGLWHSGVKFTDEIYPKYQEAPSKLHDNGRLMKVPLITILDNGGYLPVYNLAEQLQIKITLEVGKEAVWGEGTMEENTYYVSEPYMLLDGLTILGGGEMNEKPYRFHAINTISYKNQITTGQESPNISYDIKKTSLKKVLGAFWNDQETVTQDYRVRRCFCGGVTVTQPSVEGYISSQLCNDFVFNLGGINFPFARELDLQEQYLQVEKYFHKYDITNGLESDWMYGYKDGWYLSKSIPEPLNLFVLGPSMISYPLLNTILCATFDRLEQTSEIISGIDSERFDIQLRFTGISRATTQGTATYNTAEVNWDGNLYFLAFFSHDCIVTFDGGQINLQD